MNTTALTIHGIAMDYVIQKKMNIRFMLDYINENKLFEECKAMERDEHLYLYQIPMEQWKKITGFGELPYNERIEMEGGVMFSYCYYEADYTEHDSPTYMYLAVL